MLENTPMKPFPWMGSWNGDGTDEINRVKVQNWDRVTFFCSKLHRNSLPQVMYRCVHILAVRQWCVCVCVCVCVLICVNMKSERKWSADQKVIRPIIHTVSIRLLKKFYWHTHTYLRCSHCFQKRKYALHNRESMIEIVIFYRKETLSSKIETSSELDNSRR